MTHEMPRGEIYHSPEGGLFNVSAMSDAQIVEINAALQRHFDYADENYSAVGAERHQESHNLLDAFAADVRGLGQTDPTRLRNIVTICVQGAQDNARQLGAEIAEGLIDYDYTFTRDVLVGLYTENYISQDDIDVEYAADRARDRIALLMRDRLNPEQVDDFNQHIALSGDRSPIEPADPEDR